jgi:hypothetical protein
MNEIQKRLRSLSILRVNLGQRTRRGSIFGGDGQTVWLIDPRQFVQGLIFAPFAQDGSTYATPLSLVQTLPQMSLVTDQGNGNLVAVHDLVIAQTISYSGQTLVRLATPYFAQALDQSPTPPQVGSYFKNYGVANNGNDDWLNANFIPNRPGAPVSGWNQGNNPPFSPGQPLSDADNGYSYWITLNPRDSLRLLQERVLDNLCALEVSPFAWTASSCATPSELPVQPSDPSPNRYVWIGLASVLKCDPLARAAIMAYGDVRLAGDFDWNDVFQLTFDYLNGLD